ncbi:MAG TPA: ion transporter [Thermoanaerobaculia bacterium]|nr:ion transporter [Thermoanaerobaculia bacterium]
MSMSSERAEVPYLIFMLSLSVVAVVALAISAFGKTSASTRTILEYADTAVCVLFFIDFLVMLARAKNRWRYLATWGWLDLVSSIPGIDVFRLGRAARVLRIIRVLRGFRAAKVLTAFILDRRAQSTFFGALLISILLIILSASAVLQFETSSEANIRTPEDAIWWAVVTITTVGYGDRFPLSTEGRVIATFLMTAGVGLFGTFSGFVAAWFLEAPRSPSAEVQAISKLEEEVRKLREQLKI